jgi:CTD kinase subunit beta
LDLYTHYKSSTVVGPDHALEHFISIRITLNQEASANNYPRYTQGPRKQATNGTKATNGSAKSKGTKDSRSLSSPLDDQTKDLRVASSTGSVNGLTSHGKHGVKDGTVRFMLDPGRARDEKQAVAEFFKVEEEEYEVEVEVERERRRS